MTSTQLSQNPVDQLIRDLIQTARTATAEEIERIIDRMATAPFDPGQVRVPQDLRGAIYGGRTLGRSERFQFVHLVQRVLADREWAVGTTEAEYDADLRRAVREPSARVVVYSRRGGHIAAVYAPNNIAVARRGPAAKPWLFVVYSADRGILLTGHQVSEFPSHRVPPDLRWLK